MNRPRSAAGYVFLWSLRLALSAIFIYAGAVKLRDPHAFAESIASFRLLPRAFISPATLALPPLEILAGVLALLDGRLRRAGSFCLLALLVVFILALGAAQIRGLKVDCGCFGANAFDVLSPGKELWLDLLRDLAFAIVAWFLYVSASRGKPRSA